MSDLTHMDDRGQARMVDVSAKAQTHREAVAQATVRCTSKQTTQLLASGGLPKGDALAVARIAGISAAKKTSDLIPLCHPLSIAAVSVDAEVGDGEVTLTARVTTTGPTGVEMEALTAVSVAALSLYDMIKAVDRGASIDDIHVVSKSGGKSGSWERSESGELEAAKESCDACVLTVSDRRALGEEEDTTGPALRDALAGMGFTAVRTEVIPDDAGQIASSIMNAVRSGARLVVTTGGTGVGPRDVTPDATRTLLECELPGLAEAVRAKGRDASPTADLSRAVSGLIGTSLVVNLPGSVGAVRDGISVLTEVVPHLLDQISGGDHG